jgi:hypothetical protein
VLGDKFRHNSTKFVRKRVLRSSPRGDVAISQMEPVNWNQCGKSLAGIFAEPYPLADTST